MPRPAELGAAKGVGDHLGNRRTGMHFGAVLGHRPEHADGIHALVRLLQAVGALHRPAEGHHCVPFRSGGGQPGDQVGAARPGGDQRHPGLAGQAADRRRHKGRVGLMAHHHRFNRWRVLQRIEHPVDLGARNAENVFDALRFQVFHHQVGAALPVIACFSCAMVPPPKKTIAGISPRRNESRDPNPLDRGWRARNPHHAATED